MRRWLLLIMLAGLVATLTGCARGGSPPALPTPDEFRQRPTDTPPAPVVAPTVVRVLPTPTATATLSPLQLTADAGQRARNTQLAADQQRACDEIAALYTEHGQQFDRARALANPTELTLTEMRILIYGSDGPLLGRLAETREQMRRDLVNRCLGR